MLWTRRSSVIVFRDFPCGLLQIIMTVMLLRRNLKKMMIVMLLLRHWLLKVVVA